MAHRNKILIIIVLYKSNLEQSLTYNSLKNNVEWLNVPYEILIFNNSKSIEVPESRQYKVYNSDKNKKLSGAYNFGLNHANVTEAEWMLLLDQDTELTREFLIAVSSTLVNNSNPNIVNIVPRLTNDGKRISPHRIRFFNSIRVPISKSGVYANHLIALNSASLLRVSFLNAIGGFSEEFELDMLDYRTCLNIYKDKKQIYVLDTELNHELSVINMEKQMSEERYKALLTAEKRYIELFGYMDMLMYQVRILFRYLKQALFFKNKTYAHITLKFIFEQNLLPTSRVKENKSNN